jgi:hypothetical protein
LFSKAESPVEDNEYTDGKGVERNAVHLKLAVLPNSFSAVDFRLESKISKKQTIRKL